MKSSAFFPLIFGVVIIGCAHPYTLDSLGGKSEELNGVSLSTVTAPRCVFQAGYQYSNPHEMLVKIRIMNKEKGAFDVDYTNFTLVGPKETLKSSPLAASDPEKYVRDLKAGADVLENQTRMESYQGVEELGALRGEATDGKIDAAKDAFQRKKGEAEVARKQADEIRARIAMIEPAALRKATVKSGESTEGALIFKAEFGETGVVTLESGNPACPAKLQFMLKK
jgi:hypothetical protein